MSASRTTGEASVSWSGWTVTCTLTFIPRSLRDGLPARGKAPEDLIAGAAVETLQAQQRGQLEGIPIEAHRRTFAAATAALIAEFGSYLDHGEADPSGAWLGVGRSRSAEPGREHRTEAAFGGCGIVSS